MEKSEFIQLMLGKFRYMSTTNRKRLLNMIMDYGIKTNGDVSDKSEGDNEISALGDEGDVESRPHKPKDTAAFLALFNDDSNRGFKYLTHKPAGEMEYGDYLDAVVKIFFEKSNEYKIPVTLFSMMKAALTGQAKWTAWNGKMQEYNYDVWKNQVKNNPEMEKLKKADLYKMAKLFRETVRIQAPDLEKIVKDIEMDLKGQSPEFNLKISCDELDEADFYTYVYWLREGIKKILEDICSRENDAQVEISYRGIDEKSEEYGMRIIFITHCGSKGHAYKQAKQKILGGTSSAFKEIRKCFYGYCNWSVEAMWNEGSKRLNILSDNLDRKSEEEMEEIPNGFTHILTYYYKNR